MEVVFFSVVFGGFAVMLLIKRNDKFEFSPCEDSDSCDN